MRLVLRWGQHRILPVRMSAASHAGNAGFPAHEIGAIIRHLRSQRDILEGQMA
jgi:hypothetical protein